MSEPTPALETHPGDELLAELADDFLRRYRAGEQPSVDEYVAKHPELAERIRELFPAVIVMEQPGPGATVDLAPPAERVGAIIGRYKLLERIGEGGFGVVYMAEQQHPVRRKVALKVVKPGMDSRQVLARFDAERQALAIMDHPNIAKVFDAGATDSGRPYFVMELVRGEPITEFCDRNQLSPRERLELFAQVCHAVQHAHQKGIIHRDIKPTNVLAAMHDTTPVVKVIDFGVAKALGQELTDKTLFTGFAQFLGTPLYMSPEQAGQSALDIDTRSDIYSLGVLLYELLTGTTPFDKERFRKAAQDEICRIIREEEPPKPSTRLSESKDSLPSISAQRQTEPAKLTKLVRGELDWIVMKALEKERTRRYETAIGIARDIERYLHDEPVEACPPSAAYRMKKFVRRNRAAFATAAVVTMALVTGTVVSTWQAIRATRAEHLADARLDSEIAARAAAEANFQKARQAVDEYFTLVSESTLFDVPGLQPLRRDLLEAALRFYMESANQRSGDPDVLADLAVTYIRVAEIYHATDRNDDGVATVEKALDAIDQLRREHPTATAAHRKLAGFWKGLRRITTGTEMPRDTEQAFQALKRLAETWDILSAENPSVVEFQNDLAAIEAHLGDLLTSSGKSDAAAPFLLKAQAIWEKLVREHPTVSEYKADLARVCETLAKAHASAGRWEEAERLFRRNLELFEHLVAENPKSPQYRGELAGILDRVAHLSKNPQDAESAARRAVVLDIELVEEFPTATPYHEGLADHTRSFAQLLESTGKTEEALSLLRKSFPLLSQHVANPVSKSDYQNKMAALYRVFSDMLRRSGVAAEATEALAASCELYKELNLQSPNNPLYQNLLTANYISFAEAAISKSNHAEAEATLRQAKQCFDELAAAHPTNPNFRRLNGLFQGRLARLLTTAGHTDAANLAIQDAIDSHQKIIEEFPEYDELGLVYLNLAIMHAAANQPEPAEAAYEVGAEMVGKNPNLLNDFAWRFVTAPEARFHQPRWAVELARKATELTPNNGTILNTLGAALYRAGDWQGAADTLQKSMELGAGGNAFNWFFRAMTEWRLGNKDAARDWHEEAVEWMQANASDNEQLIRFRAEAVELIGTLSPEERAASKQRRWDRELAELSQEVESNPADAEPYHARGIRLCQVGRVGEAVADFDKALELKPDDHQLWYEAAQVDLYAGDVERYRSACRELLDRFESLAKENPEIADRTAKVCALASDSTPNFALVEQLAERCITGTENHGSYRNFMFAKGLVDYRSGRHEKALEWLQRCSPTDEVHPWYASAHATLAMVHHRLEHADEARESLEAARAIISQKPADTLNNHNWFDWLYCEVLFREAEKIFAK